MTHETCALLLYDDRNEGRDPEPWRCRCGRRFAWHAPFETAADEEGDE